MAPKEHKGGITIMFVCGFPRVYTRVIHKPGFANTVDAKWLVMPHFSGEDALNDKLAQLLRRFYASIAYLISTAPRLMLPITTF
jgi:hypothetical protein